MAHKAAVEVEIQTLIANRQWDNLVRVCEQYELEISNEPPSVNVGPFYGIQLFAYLIVNDVNSARFLWKRIPTEVRAAHNELVNIWKIGQCVWKAEYVNLYSALRQNWSLIYQPLVTAFFEKFRFRTFELISRAYSSISAIDCGIILGYPVDDVVKLVTEQGWRYDPATKLISPLPYVEPKIQHTDLEQLSSLTRFVVFLEGR